MLTRKVDMGTPVTDVVSGFYGHIVGFYRLNCGCDNLLVQATGNTTEKVSPNEWFDANRLRAIDSIKPLEKLETLNSIKAFNIRLEVDSKFEPHNVEDKKHLSLLDKTRQSLGITKGDGLCK